ncbi:MAG: hypothetical protein IT513_10995 [Burkholderiales bacterium]|nr:hypothetical protein [Burkholderiales bacterium]
MKEYILFAVCMLPTVTVLGAAATSLAHLDECVAVVTELPQYQPPLNKEHAS